MQIQTHTLVGRKDAIVLNTNLADSFKYLLTAGCRIYFCYYIKYIDGRAKMEFSLEARPDGKLTPASAKDKIGAKFTQIKNDLLTIFNLPIMINSNFSSQILKTLKRGHSIT